jgi:hypothetical protein
VEGLGLRTFVGAAHVLSLACFVGVIAATPAGAQDGGQSGSPFAGSALLGGENAAAPGNGQLSIPGALTSADPSTGTARSAYPFRLEGARGAVQPTLGLTYSSSDGQREAGVGWGIDLPAIERRNPSGGPAYVNDPPAGGAVVASTDRFVFGGAPLVPVCRVDDHHRCDAAAAGEVMPDWAVAGWTYFRMEVDDSFDRFFWSPDHNSWRVQSKSGAVREYGLAADGVDQGGIDREAVGGGAFRWNLVRLYDPMGTANEIFYVWKTLAPPSDGVSAMGYLSDIYDTSLPGQPSNLNLYAHRTQLVWEPDPAAPPVSLQPSLFRMRPSYRLAQVNVWSMGPKPDRVARNLVRSYGLGYIAPGAQGVGYHRSLLSTIKMTGACPGFTDDNVGLLTLNCASLPATSFTYSSATAPRTSLTKTVGNPDSGGVETLGPNP